MKSSLTWLRQYACLGAAALGLLAALPSGVAHAGNVGISVGIHVPGVPVYAMPPPPPPPRYYRPAPPPPVVYYAPPAYHGHWAPPPPRHAKGKHFKHHRGHPAHRPHHHRDHR